MHIRRARAADVEPIVAMLADDRLGATRESTADLGPYERAFARIDADPNQVLVVADRRGLPVGTLQLTVIPGLARSGATRGQIEAVRVHADLRGDGLGARLLRWAIEEARARGCALVQLTSDASRGEAHRFYEGLGFSATHTGFKLAL
ncbi:GNAT family N-acetyltransferase [Amycolatopsis antarctica]|uniref:GNAT family N-acetyltransferase n=1 Tax=Amycolatopsis antarctica TaxID=1854586 RepID=UPI003B83838C